MKVESETREDKFRRVAERRVNAIIDKLRLLGHLANKSNYSYTDEQVEAIFRAIQKDLNATKSKFVEGSNGHKPFAL